VGPANPTRRRSAGDASHLAAGWLQGFGGISKHGEQEWHLRKARSLLKVLALSPGNRLHREQAMELLWPDLAPKAALNNLHYALHVARRTLEPSALDSSSATSRYGRLRGEQLTLCPDSPLWVDVQAFQEAAVTARRALEPQAFRVAIDLYAGDLLPEDRYERWVEERRAQLKELYLSLLSTLGALYEERKEFGEAIEALSRVVAEEQTHERAHLGLMRLYALLGRRREALSQYEHLGTRNQGRTHPPNGRSFAGRAKGRSSPREQWPNSALLKRTSERPKSANFAVTEFYEFAWTRFATVTVCEPVSPPSDTTSSKYYAPLSAWPELCLTSGGAGERTLPGSK
jgi:DNA-binding SARP family transcriptional activator